MPETDKNIIIRKYQKKVQKHGHHGGMWKVAYADFMTAMMLFFLLMWLLSTIPPEELVKVKEYFSKEDNYDVGHGISNEKSYGISDSSLKKQVTEQLTGAFSSTDYNNSVRLVPSGEKVEISIESTEEKLIFEDASGDLTQYGKEVVSYISQQIQRMPFLIDITAHSNGKEMKQNDSQSDWELTLYRANTTRKLLNETGVEENRILYVAGYADKKQAYSESPEFIKNRRITIEIMLRVQNIQENEG